VAGKTFYQSDRVLDLFLGQSVAGAAATYVNLFVTNPAGDNDAGTEWSLSRVRVYQQSSQGSPYWSGPASDGNRRYVDNSGTISWTTAVGYTANETVVGIGIWDAETAGNLLYWKDLSVNRTLAADEEIAFGTGALKVRED